MKRIAMKNDTPVFDAMRFDANAGENVWTGFTGTREAIQRDGFAIDKNSLSYCPHEWLNSRGYIELELVRKHPHPVAV
jgi:hypothetical protein